MRETSVILSQTRLFHLPCANLLAFTASSMDVCPPLRPCSFCTYLQEKTRMGSLLALFAISAQKGANRVEVEGNGGSCMFESRGCMFEFSGLVVCLNGAPALFQVACQGPRGSRWRLVCLDGMIVLGSVVDNGIYEPPREEFHPCRCHAKHHGIFPTRVDSFVRVRVRRTRRRTRFRHPRVEVHM